MPSFFADPAAEVVVEFEDGTKAYLLREMDAGIQEDISDEMIKLRIQNERRNGGTSTDEETRADVKTGNLVMIQRMLRRIELPDGKTLTAPIGMGTLRRLHRETYAKLLDVINENNAPLSRLRENQGEAADLAME